MPERQKYTAQRKKARAKLLQVAEALTGKHYDDDTFLYATAGRNEFRNKGLDMFIDATNDLRNGHGMNRQTIAFILVPAWENGAREDLKSRLEKGETQGALEDCIITHRLHDYSSDAIYNKLEYLGMHNSTDSKVDTIYVPCYLNGSDGIFNMQYYDLLIGFDAAVFASYYEPWGYTPHESMAFGIPTITTDLAGFGQWILSTFGGGFSKCGVKVTHRSDSNYEMAVSDIAEKLKYLLTADVSLTKKIRKAAISSSKGTAWADFIRYYDTAYTMALENNKHNLA